MHCFASDIETLNHFDATIHEEACGGANSQLLGCARPGGLATPQHCDCRRCSAAGNRCSSTLLLQRTCKSWRRCSPLAASPLQRCRPAGCWAVQFLGSQPHLEVCSSAATPLAQRPTQTWTPHWPPVASPRYAAPRASTATRMRRSPPGDLPSKRPPAPSKRRSLRTTLSTGGPSCPLILHRGRISKKHLYQSGELHGSIAA